MIRAPFASGSRSTPAERYDMNAALQCLAIGLMAATFLTASPGFLPERAHAKPIDEGYAQTCISISRRVAEVVEEYHNQWASPGTNPDPRFVEEYRNLLGQWYANGCDKSFGSLPRLNPRASTGVPQHQLSSPANQVVAAPAE